MKNKNNIFLMFVLVFSVVNIICSQENIICDDDIVTLNKEYFKDFFKSGASEEEVLYHQQYKEYLFYIKCISDVKRGDSDIFSLRDRVWILDYLLEDKMFSEHDCPDVSIQVKKSYIPDVCQSAEEYIKNRKIELQQADSSSQAASECPWDWQWEDDFAGVEEAVTRYLPAWLQK